MRDALEGLRRSRRLQAEIQHPQILPVVDFFEQHGEWFSVFPRVPDAQIAQRDNHLDRRRTSGPLSGSPSSSRCPRE